MFDAVRILAVLPAEGESPVELSERVLGDTKALTDTPVRRWVLRLLAAAVGVDEPSTGAERAAVWEQFGVIDSGLASRVLTLGVRLEGHPAAATISGAAADAGVHQVWTLAQLRAWTATLAAGEVYVCENPTVVEAAERELGAGAGRCCAQRECRPRQSVSCSVQPAAPCIGAVISIGPDYAPPVAHVPSSAHCPG